MLHPADAASGLAHSLPDSLRSTGPRADALLDSLTLWDALLYSLTLWDALLTLSAGLLLLALTLSARLLLLADSLTMAPMMVLPPSFWGQLLPPSWGLLAARHQIMQTLTKAQGLVRSMLTKAPIVLT